MLYKYLVTVTLIFLFLSLAGAQKNVAGIKSYTAAENKCNQVIEKENFKAAESVCKNALILAKRLSDENKPEKMRAYENYAFTFFSQNKFQLALNNFTEAFEIGKTFLTESDSDLGYAYFNLGRASQGLSKLEKAIEYYKKAEQIYRSVYEKATNSESKTKAKASIRRTLLLQRFVARYQNDENTYKEIENKLADLDTPNK